MVARSWTGRATAFFTCTVPTTVSPSSRTGKRECPVSRASSITARARSFSSRLRVRTRGVMISPVVRAPNSTDRSISSAVSGSRVPTSAEREISEASSVELRADRSSSCGSSPNRRTAALAEPLRNRIGYLLSAVNQRIGNWVTLAVAIGRATARFFGTSSPKSMVRNVLSTRPMASAVGWMAPSGMPSASSGSSTISAIAGSARKPMPRFVIVIPTWAPDSWVDRERIATRTPSAAVSPSFAARSTCLRSTVTNANSAATKTPQIAIRRAETPSRIQGVIGGLRCRWFGVVRTYFESRPSGASRGPLPCRGVEALTVLAACPLIAGASVRP